MSNILDFLKSHFSDIKSTLEEVSAGLCNLETEVINIDMLKRYEVNNKIFADNISTPDTIGIFKDKVVFIEFKDVDENFLENKEKRLSLFLKQVDVLILFYFLHDDLLKGLLDEGVNFWMVYGKESYKKAIKRHFKIYGINKRYRFIYRAVLPVSKDNFLKYLTQGLLRL